MGIDVIGSGFLPQSKGMMDSHCMVAGIDGPSDVIMANPMAVFRRRDCGAAWRDMAMSRISPLTHGCDIVTSPTTKIRSMLR